MQAIDTQRMEARAADFRATESQKSISQEPMTVYKSDAAEKCAAWYLYRGTI